MSQLAAMPALNGSKPVIVDVWSRTAPKYRRRAVVMLVLLGLLFAGLCCFTFWLRTGVLWPWECNEYGDLMVRSFRPAGLGQVTLSDILSSPISVREVPIHGVIMGLTFATLSSIPILVAILYRFPSSILLAAMVMFLAAMPWLGLTILGGCALASLPPFRFHFRYASALVGLVPVGVYFVMASWEPAGSRARSVENLALLYAPWVLALLSSCVIFALALAMAKLINYRPGGITPVLGLLFAIPIVLFYAKVGRDELEYRILEREVGPGSRKLFQPVDVEAESNREATRAWIETREKSYAEIKRPIMAAQLEKQMAEAENDASRSEAECESFIERFPRSPYIPQVLFLEGQALDQRINRAKLMSQHQVEFRADVPSLRSQRIWETLNVQFPQHELSAMALYKLAYLHGMQNRFGEALQMLETLMSRFDVTRTTSQPGSGRDQPAGGQGQATMFRKSPRPSALGLEMEILLRQARRLGEMIRACKDDVGRPYGEVFVSRGGTALDRELVHPLGLMLGLDEMDPHSGVNLQGILDHFPQSRAAGYAEIRLVAMEPAISRRITRMQRVEESATGGSGKPSGAEAMFRLAEVLEEDSVTDLAREMYGQLVQSYPESCWALEGKERLAALTLAEQVAPRRGQDSRE